MKDYKHRVIIRNSDMHHLEDDILPWLRENLGPAAWACYGRVTEETVASSNGRLVLRADYEYGFHDEDDALRFKLIWSR